MASNAQKTWFGRDLNRFAQGKVLDAIQLDVEGWEFPVLDGGRSTIARCRPVISVETVGTDTLDLMRSLSYVEMGRNVADTVFAPGPSKP